MKLFNKFKSDDSGAITVDWVVLTAAIVGMGIAVMVAVSSGINDAATDINGEATGAGGNTVTAAITGTALQTSTTWSGLFASDYVAQGAALAPGNNGATYYWATQFATADAPAGYNFDNPLSDPVSGNVIYTSDDGLNYSIGGQVTPISDYTGTAAYFGA